MTFDNSNWGSAFQRLLKKSTIYFFLFFVVLGFSTGISPAHAQESGANPALTSQSLKPIVDQAKKDGLTVVVIAPTTKDDAQSKVPEKSFSEKALMVRQGFIQLVENSQNFFSDALDTLLLASPDGTLNWLYIAIATAIGGILVGYLPALYIRRRGRDFFKSLYNPIPQNLAEKVSYLLFRGVMIVFNMAVLFVVSMAAALVFDSGHEPSRITIFTIVGGYVTYQFIRFVIFLNLTAEDVPSHRVINLSDEDAKTMHRDWKVVTAIATILLWGCFWMDKIGLNASGHKLSLIASMLIIVLILAFLTIKERKMFSGVILGPGEPETKPAWLRTFANTYHIPGLVYLAVAWIISTARIILDLPNALILVAAPVIAFIGGMAAYGFVLIAIERFYKIRRNRFDQRVAAAKIAYQEQLAAEEREKALTEPEQDEEMIINRPSSQDHLDEQPVFRPVFRSLFERAAAILIGLFALGFLFSTWDINIGKAGNPITAFMDSLMVIFIAWFCYSAVNVFIAAKMEEQGIEADATPGEPGEEMSGQGASRLATLLPLIKIVSTITIFVLAGMILLSGLGVDIAPLFAGAGVIGLAVGFGAQTLIRDIFSGGFFLFDDAFRKGEYIELGQIRGTVEKISLRSFQLRHHNGPLHTIPFGEITQLTNYSRDWVMMKLPLRVTYDTDVERVRKLVKKLGQKLLEREDVGKNFLQPLKSQGVYKMEDSAMIIRVKFMTKPGDQFVTRKVVYQEIRDLFEREGIKFAHKEVTVRLADEDVSHLSENEKKAVSAAARSAIDDDAANPPAVDDGP